jgi:glycerol-3-phosphate dehydrogenase
MSRDYVISENPATGVIFIAGGKWTTWREMAQDVVDKIVASGSSSTATAKPCRTLEIKLHGGEGYTEDLAKQLVQTHKLDQDVADHLVATYGGRVWEVVELLVSDDDVNDSKRRRRRLVEGFPYIEAVVAYACREYACTIEDILSRRTRLAFLDKDAAIAAIPRVSELMACLPSAKTIAFRNYFFHLL